MLTVRAIGIGFGSSSASCNRFPGWDPDTWGYHGDDGYRYHGSVESLGPRRPWGPNFKPGDIIGCCISFSQRLIFYTRNGKVLDRAFTDLKFEGTEQNEDDIYVMIGLYAQGDHVHVNFGKEPFAFNIAERCKMLETSF